MCYDLESDFVVTFGDIKIDISDYIAAVFIDDGLHLNEKGNRIWAAAIKAVLMKVEAQYETTAE